MPPHVNRLFDAHAGQIGVVQVELQRQLGQAEEGEPVEPRFEGGGNDALQSTWVEEPYVAEGQFHIVRRRGVETVCARGEFGKEVGLRGFYRVGGLFVGLACDGYPAVVLQCHLPAPVERDLLSGGECRQGEKRQGEDDDSYLFHGSVNVWTILSGCGRTVRRARE